MVKEEDREKEEGQRRGGGNNGLFLSFPHPLKGHSQHRSQKHNSDV